MSPNTSFPDPDLTTALEAFVAAARTVFAGRLVSVLLHGSILFDDLAPGYGDLDFIAVTSDELTEEDCAALIAARRPFRAGAQGVYGLMLEGAFFSRRMLDPEEKGRMLWWGTSGERLKDTNSLGWFCLHLLREKGLVLWGEDLRPHLPPAPPEALRHETHLNCRDVKEHGRGGSLHSVDWLLTVARALYWLREGEVISKSQAADWATTHAAGEWRHSLPGAKDLRHHPELMERTEIQTWVAHLTPTIQQAAEELERALAEVTSSRALVIYTPLRICYTIPRTTRGRAAR